MAVRWSWLWLGEHGRAGGGRRRGPADALQSVRKQRGSHARSDTRDFHIHRRRTKRKLTKKFTLTAANLIGQLGDPHYLRKANALYYEFEETGLNRQLGYGSPATWSISIRNSIGTMSLRTSSPLSATSM